MKIKLAGLDLTQFVEQPKTNLPKFQVNDFGIFTFSKEAIEKLQLKPESIVSLDHEEGKPSEWYLVVNAPVGFHLRERKSSGLGQHNVLCFQNKAFARFVIDNAGVKKFHIANTPEVVDGLHVYYPIKAKK